MANKKKADEGKVKVRDTEGGEELSGTLSEIGKRYGNVITAGSSAQQPDRIPTGAFMLDFCTLGGIPTSRITKLVGQKHAGKSLTADKIIASAQNLWPDRRVVKLDMEGTHESVWSEKLGVNQDALLLAQPETGEHALDMCDALIHTKEISLIVVDSLAQLVPAKEMESSSEDQHVGLQSRLIGSFVRKAVSGMIAERRRGHQVTLLFINQFRSKIGGWSPTGDPLTEPGGKGLGFAYSLEITMKNKEQSGKDDHGIDSMTENEHAFSITKNKLNGGPRTGEFRVRRIADERLGLGIGDIDDAETLLAYGKKFGVYTGGGSSWKLDFWDEEHSFGKLDDAVRQLYEDRNLYWKFRNYLICEQASHLGMPDSFLERFYPD